MKFLHLVNLDHAEMVEHVSLMDKPLDADVFLALQDHCVKLQQIKVHVIQIHAKMVANVS